MHPGAQTPMHAWGSQTPMHPGATPLHPGATPLHAPATPSWDPTRCDALFIFQFLYDGYLFERILLTLRCPD